MILSLTLFLLPIVTHEMLPLKAFLLFWRRICVVRTFFSSVERDPGREEVAFCRCRVTLRNRNELRNERWDNLNLSTAR